jgi:hypothetical protein
MNKIISILALYALGIVLTIMVMINGWGLEPKSWWWIIGGGIVLRFIIEMIQAAAKKGE